MPTIPSAHLKAPGSAVVVAVASPKQARETRPHPKRREIWDEVYPDSLKEPEYESTSYEYHVFSRRKKWLIIVLVGLTGTLPGLTFNMFLPAVDTIAKDLVVGPAAVGATIASYLALQGTTSMVLVPLSDSVGRRPVLIFTLLLYVIASVVLSMTSSIYLLFVLRGAQAIGMAPIIQISRAVLDDISLPSERNVFSSFFQRYHSMLFVSAPAMGGLFLSTRPFQFIFVFLLSVSAAAFIAIAFCLPETARSIVGNGSVPATGIHVPWAVWFRPLKDSDGESEDVKRSEDGLQERSDVDFAEPLRLFREKDTVAGLVFAGVVFAVWMMVTVSTPGMFKKAFDLNDVMLGLAFVANFLGVIVGSMVMDRILARNYYDAAYKYTEEHQLPPSHLLNGKDLPADFLLEHTRLWHLIWLVPILVVTVSGYGFTLTYPSATSRPGWILLPMALQFIIAAAAHAVCTIQQTLITDLWNQNEQASTNAGNLAKYLLAALAAGLIQLQLDGMGAWSSFVSLGLVIMTCLVLPVAQWYWGGEWRAEREAKIEILNRMKDRPLV
ncbi:MFS general substrate transporter [Lophiostoma macrostomum CBS 122681]|uniref:MFS general substrate transporter n=1 Tax=Lophiostoma macrostomum CBS 122681 TaxID=1314788 RepID=A0A6A6SV42_9PLEO|nr:MFS general substrate transporter [Lophiostoma macrostomum CBS 122681]